MREIKFRTAHYSNVKDKFSHFSYWGLINHKGNHDSECFQSPTHSLGSHRKYNEQFTGLKDKNGVDIYLGDILNIGTDDFGIVNNNGVNVAYEVIIDGCDFVLYRKDIKLKWGRLSRIFEMSWDCQVVGNIHQNPELL